MPYPTDSDRETKLMIFLLFVAIVSIWQKRAVTILCRLSTSPAHSPALFCLIPKMRYNRLNLNHRPAQQLARPGADPIVLPAQFSAKSEHMAPQE